MFKIVQTQERGKTLLSIVPHLWEKDNNLYWPPLNIKPKELDLMLKDEHSVPLLNWTVYPCTLKRDKLTMQQALQESKAMFAEFDTDGGEQHLPVKRKVMQRSHIGRPSVVNFSSLVRFIKILF